MKCPIILLSKVEGFQATSDDRPKGHFFFLFLFCFLSITLTHAQSDCSMSDVDMKIIVNEIGNFSGTPEDGGREYIELLVLGNPENPNELVDLTGYIIDDNNAASKDMGNEQGHVRFGECFPLVPAGSIILIYNEQLPALGIERLHDGLPNQNGIYQVPFGNQCLQKYNYPTHTTSNYGPYNPGNLPDINGFWKEFIPFRDYGDAVIIGDKNGNITQTFYWSYKDWYEESDLQFMVPSDAILEVEISAGPEDPTFSFSLTNKNWMQSSSYTKNNNGTPGQPNNEINAQFIESLKNNGGNLSLIECEFNLGMHPEGFSIEPTLDIKSNNYPCEIFIYLDGEFVSQTLVGDNLFFLSSLSDQPGTYNYRIENKACELEGTFIIPALNEIESLLCESECEEINFDPDGTGSNNSSDCFVLIDSDGNIISTDNGTLVICGDKNDQEYISVIKDAEGNVTEINKYTYKSANLDVIISADLEIICDGQSAEITCEGDNIMTYLWSTGAITSSITVTEAGIYSVTVQNADGCKVIREIEIFDQSQLHEYFISDGYSCVVYDDISIDLTHSFEAEYIKEEAEILAFYNNEVYNINEDIRSAFNDLNSKVPYVYSTIKKVESCEDILTLKGGENTSESSSRSGFAWYENEILALTNLDSNNKSVYIKNIVNKTEDTENKIFLVNESNVSTSKIKTQINYFTSKIKMPFTVETTIPSQIKIGKNEVFCIIGENPSTTARIVYSTPAIINNIPLNEKIEGTNYPQPCSNIADWFVLEDSETELIEVAADPLILFNANGLNANFLDNTFNPLRTTGDNTISTNDNDLKGKPERLYGFITLHGVGHTANIVHVPKNANGTYAVEIPKGKIDGSGFMGSGNNMEDQLKWPYEGTENYSTMEAPTFEALIEWTLKLSPEILGKFKERFKQE